MLISRSLKDAMADGLDRKDIFILDKGKLVCLYDLIGDKEILADYNSSKYDIHIDVREKDDELERWAKEQEDIVAANIRKDEEMRKAPYIPHSAEKTKAIKSKTENERTAVIRLWNSGKSYEEISSELNIPVYTVEKHFERFALYHGNAVIRERRIPYEVPIEVAS